MRSSTAFAALALALGACASSGAPAPAPVRATSPAAPRRAPNEIRWVRTSAEYRALAIQTYEYAATRLAAYSRRRAPGSWGVILDADETVLDNSEYQRRRALLDSGYTETSWAAWVRERAAREVPGAASYTRRVHAMGGRVVIVTNRADSLCADTRENLRAVGVEADAVLCQQGRESDKNPRFLRVQNGTAAPGLPALDVVQWFGDNIQDFPGLSQEVARNNPSAFNDFGARYFVLPNPMYGSWERNAEP